MNGYPALSRPPEGAAPGQFGSRSLFQQLNEYLQECYTSDEPLDHNRIRELLSRARPSAEDWAYVGDEDSFPPLHSAVMNEVTPPQEQTLAINVLLEFGADPTVKDEDGDTALTAVIELARDSETDDETKTIHAASVLALINCPRQPVGGTELAAICSWLRLYMPEDLQIAVIQALKNRAGEAAVSKVWSGEQLLKYLEGCAYEQASKGSVEAAKIRQFMDAGASPAASQNGATALSLVVLNPYCSYTELVEVFRTLIAADPTVPSMRDGFKLSPFDWAADYLNVASQHRCKPNPAGMLAIASAIADLVPDDIDTSGIRCLKVSERGEQGAACQRASLRFMEGDRVLCRVEAPGGKTVWEEGTVVAVGYREACWPPEAPGAPYVVKLDLGSQVYALVDSDKIIRKEEAKKAAPVRAAPVSVRRFRKQQRDDGSWELLDSKSGKARPCSPPDSDDD
eukprot:TRINITY_DN29103_c0_g1_i1.p1 TRINITY_DN29103_c0_g1~~TRINITY_DN29103_c0_g1_i1.p1  ORF type:complete len:455 (+),score=82.71 TRINITY_DN29103_c0_g1_i1:27-1391(+)